MTNEFDVIVIGGGPAGENAAAYARDNGLEVALVERELVGGECSSWASMPSKALLRPGEALAAARWVPRPRRPSPARWTSTRRSGAVTPSRPTGTTGTRSTGSRPWTTGGATTAKGDPREIPDRLLVLGGGVVLTFADGTELVADELLVATGRRPRTGDLGLDTVGLEPGRSIETDDQLRAIGVDGGWLYAVGDVNGRALLTHHGKYQARLVGDHLAGKDVEARADHQAVVRVIFTDPQVAAVGLTEAGAREQGLDVKTLSYGIGNVAGGDCSARASPARPTSWSTPRPAPSSARRPPARAWARCSTPRPSRSCRHHRRPALARRPGVPDGQRGLAAAPRDRPRHGVMRDAAAAHRGGGR